MRSLPQDETARGECWVARATLYVGHARVVDLHINEQCRLWLTGQEGEGSGSPFKGIHAELFDLRWQEPQELPSLVSISGSLGDFVDAVTSAAGPAQIGKEGLLQAALSSWPEDFVVIDRESIPQGLTEAHRAAALEPVEQALVDLQRSEKSWTFTRRPKDAPSPAEGGRGDTFGTELDALAIDRLGRLLVIEAKDASDTGGVGWTPAQVAVYARLFQQCIAANTNQTDIFNKMLAQRQQIGLAPRKAHALTPNSEMVPVIVVGGELGKSAATANSRMMLVAEALDRAGVSLEGLEIWQVKPADFGQTGAIQQRDLGTLH